MAEKEKSKLPQSEEEWKAYLPMDRFEVLRNAGTEPPFDNALWDNKKHGIYVCGGCGTKLFDSSTKFDSGTGWPSFFDPLERSLIKTKVDNSIPFRTRTEALCAKCSGHLGHVFDDGPQPTGIRYCMNSLSLKFEEKKN